MLQTLQERRNRTAVDRELARRLHHAVEQAKLNVRGLAFYIQDGSIAVYGSVRTETLREAVLSLVADQPGTRRITDHLQLAAA